MKLWLKTGMIGAGSLAMSILTGCGGGSGSNSTPALSSQPRSVSAVAPNGLTETLAEDADAITTGGSVTYTLTLTNTTSTAITLQLSQDCGPVDPNSPDALLTVMDPTGASVYPGSGDPSGPPCRDVPPVTQTIAPGRTLEEKIKVGGTTGVFQPFDMKGIYTARASFATFQNAATAVGPLTLTVQ
jgi:hypothetical protein